MEKVNKYGLMDLFTKVTGLMEVKLAQEKLYLTMEIFTKVNGSMVDLMGMEYTSMQTEQKMKDNG